MQRRDFNRSLLGLSIAAAVPELGLSESGKTDGNLVTSRFAGSITDVPGIQVGNYTLKERPTGCTVLLCGKGAVAGVDVRGSAPGTRETDLLNPINAMQQVQAILLSGGSAYGLEAATGVVRYLEEHHLGFPIGKLGVVPIVPAAILMDLGVGDFKIRPNAEAGYQACVAANSGPVTQGNVGAGAGATVGKMFGFKYAMKSGLGTASIRIGNTGIVVGAIVAVNASGDVYEPGTGRILAGARNENGGGFRNSMEAMLGGYAVAPIRGANTTIGAVATNAKLSKTAMTKVAQMAQDGFARTINPVHTMYDGDTIFALSTGTLDIKADTSAIGAIAAMVMEQAIVRAITSATSLPEFGLPAYHDYSSA